MTLQNFSSIINRHRLASATLLSIILPVSMLVTFRLTGVLPAPSQPEAITLETVRWESERPTFYARIDDKIGSTYDSDVFINQSVFVGKYDHEDGNYGNSDVISLVTNVTATINKGFIEAIHVFFAENYTLSEIDIWNPQSESWRHILNNLAIVDWADKRSQNAWKLKDNVKAFITLTGVNEPDQVDYWTITHWVLRSPQNQSHQMSIVYEVSYFNGTTHKKIVQPFELKIGPDDNNNFETADTIEPETYEAYVDDRNDKYDYYRFRVEKGQAIQCKLTDPLDRTQSQKYARANLYLYDPSQNLRVQSLFVEGEGRVENVTLAADAEGWWYIEVEACSPGTFLKYLLHLSIVSP